LAFTREKKQELVQEYVDLLRESPAVVFVASRGLTVAEVTQLRTKMRETGSRYHRVKNTLFSQALQQAGMPVPKVLTGPVSVAFCPEDIAPAVKAIVDFDASLGEREFEITGGIVENQVLNAERAKALATMPSKDTLFAQILAGIQAPAGQVTGLVANSIRQILNVLQARVDQLQEADAAA
jgi:large subunit ribosomal protein L10